MQDSDLLSSKGATILITGLPSSGKTTLGAALASHIEIHHGRRVTLLDGDRLREELFPELGFTREHREQNIRRHCFIATEVCRHGGIAISTLIAPFAEDRARMRAQIEKHGTFIEIHLATPLEECERRDSKGLYSRARMGKLRMMTGVDDPYEIPQNPEIRLTGAESINEVVKLVAKRLFPEA